MHSQELCRQLIAREVLSTEHSSNVQLNTKGSPVAEANIVISPIPVTRSYWKVVLSPKKALVVWHDKAFCCPKYMDLSQDSGLGQTPESAHTK